MTKGNGISIEREIAALDALDRSALLQRWRSVFGREAPPRLSRSLMVKAVAYEMQVRAFGGLSPRTIRALKAAAKPATVAASRRSPSLGTRLAREWNGVLHEVEVLDDGYLWRGHPDRVSLLDPPSAKRSSQRSVQNPAHRRSEDQTGRLVSPAN